MNCLLTYRRVFVCSVRTTFIIHGSKVIPTQFSSSKTFDFSTISLTSKLFYALWSTHREIRTNLLKGLLCELIQKTITECHKPSTQLCHFAAFQQQCLSNLISSTKWKLPE
ncbi:UNVERIFIED_CONTAM: hypothetical protein K2H54_045217 [Gekko kuhli]